MDDIIVCVPHWPDPAGSDAPAGRAYVFLGHCGDLPSATPDWIAQGESWLWDFDADPGWWHWRGSVMGSQCGSAGDVNGDGYGDVFVVEYSWSSSHGDPEGPECDPVDSSCPWGRVLVWHGGPAGLVGSGAGSATPHANWTWTGDDVLDDPLSAAAAGDLDGDGFDDLVVGSPSCCRGDDNGASGVHGRVRVFKGSAAGLESSPWGMIDRTFEYGGSFGGALGAAGDVNGDGFDDLLVGAPGYGTLAPYVPRAGRAELFAGSGSMSDVPSWSVTGTVADEEVGLNVTGVGDYDADGFADVVVSHVEGWATVSHGSSAGLGAPTTLIETDPLHPGTTYGSPTWTAGDVNGDGADDVLVARAAWDDGCSGWCRGDAFLYLGVPPGTTSFAPAEPACGPCSVTITSLTFEPPFVGIDDDAGAAYAAPHWQPAVQREYPVAISRLNLPRISAVFSVSPSIPTEVIAHVDGVGPDGLRFRATVPFSGSTLTIANVDADAPFSAHVAAHDPAIISWTVIFEGACDDEPLDAGVTRNRIYVMFGEPDPTMPMCAESVFDIACRGVNAGGSDVNYLVDQVYYNFETPDDGVPRKAVDGCGNPDGQAMVYWADAGSAIEAAMNAEPRTAKATGMLDPAPADRRLNGRGRCGAWQQLLSWCLRAHGIPWSPWPATALPRADTIYAMVARSVYDDDVSQREGILIHNWAFGDIPPGPPACQAAPELFGGGGIRGPAQPFMFREGHPIFCDPPPPSSGMVCDLAGRRAQGGDACENPTSNFDNHALVLLNGRLFDPSYGTDAVSRPVSLEAIVEWERVNVAGYSLFCDSFWWYKPNDPSIPEIELVGVVEE